MAVKKRGLSRGIGELLSSLPSASQAATQDVDGEYQQVQVDLLQANPYQPRKDMDGAALEELANSIRSQGILQPILVRKVGDSYEIVAGERRTRAAKLAGLEKVPVLVRDIDDNASMAMALIENIQREDLNPMEEAIALQRLIEEFSMTHQQIAETVGKSRTSVTNLLRLLTLNDDVKLLLEYGDIEMGHARALLSLEGEVQLKAAQQVVSKGLSVRETEALVQSFKNPKQKVHKPIDPDVLSLQDKLSSQLGSSVTIKHNSSGKGKIVISYGNIQELDSLIESLDRDSSLRRHNEE